MKIVKGVNIEVAAACYIESVAKKEHRSFSAQAAMVLEEWVAIQQKSEVITTGKEE